MILQGDYCYFTVGKTKIRKESKHRLHKSDVKRIIKMHNGYASSLEMTLEVKRLLPEANSLYVWYDIVKQIRNESNLNVR